MTQPADNIICQGFPDFAEFWTPDAHISLRTKFESDWDNCWEMDSRKFSKYWDSLKIHKQTQKQICLIIEYKT